jgi:hypothetical protein
MPAGAVLLPSILPGATTRVGGMVVGEQYVVACTYQFPAGGEQVFAWQHPHSRANPGDTAPHITLTPAGPGEDPAARRPTCILVRHQVFMRNQPSPKSLN